eukprot:Amastigsp_a509886_107.p3 type:complete len:118 gc:universal Amastigsp_a509886_107:25-378(+)
MKPARLLFASVEQPVVKRIQVEIQGEIYLALSRWNKIRLESDREAIATNTRSQFARGIFSPSRADRSVWAAQHYARRRSLRLMRHHAHRRAPRRQGHRARLRDYVETRIKCLGWPSS